MSLEQLRNKTTREIIDLAVEKGFIRNVRVQTGGYSMICGRLLLVLSKAEVKWFCLGLLMNMEDVNYE